MQDHPAFLAWKEIEPNSRIPSAIEILKNKKKSKVYRLEGVAKNNTSVIAKAGRLDSLLIERDIYEKILPDLEISSVHYLGFLKSKNEELSWIFTEFAEGDTFDISNEEHQNAALDWLGYLHSSHLTNVHISLLPDRSENSYFNYLKESRENIIQNQANPNLSSENISTLSDILLKLNILENNWIYITNICNSFPPVFIHGDFQAKNNVIQTKNSSSILVTFDWEMAGWGVPAIDLGRFYKLPEKQLKRYWKTNRKLWGDVEFQNILQLSKVGEILRLVVSIYWASKGLRFDWISRSMKNLNVYQARLVNICNDLSLF